MVFSSLIFLFGYLPIILLGNFLLKKRIHLLNLFLLVLSLIFYAWGEPYYIVLMLISICFNWLSALWIDYIASTPILKKTILILAILFNIGMLFIFKYANWILEMICELTGVSFPTLSISLPIGISFYTFQALAYVIDVWRGGVKASKSITAVGVYISLFPQLIAGPIVRYSDIAKSLQNRCITASDSSEGIWRFIAGLSKKVLLADSIAVIADKAFALNASGNAGSSFLWLGALAYALQIYYDFSGYSDMAIGLGKMLGFSFQENFNFPYAAATVTDFWRRWHISLSSWFRDYVYIPLGGSRNGLICTIRNLACVWILTGIWHGANLTFVCWGIAYGVIIIAERILKIPAYIDSASTIRGTMYRIFTLVIILLCWILFRADNIQMAYSYIAAMFCPGNFFVNTDTTWLYLSEFRFELIIGILLSIPCSYRIICKIKEHIPVLYYISEYLLFFISISYLMKGTYSPFIYFNF